MFRSKSSYCKSHTLQSFGVFSGAKFHQPKWHLLPGSKYYIAWVHLFKEVIFSPLPILFRIKLPEQKYFVVISVTQGCLKRLLCCIHHIVTLQLFLCCKYITTGSFSFPGLSSIFATTMAFSTGESIILNVET